MSEEGDEQKKTVTVKGVNEDLFRKVKAMAYQSGKTIGEMTNRAYEMLLNSAQGINELTRSFQQGIAESASLVIDGISELELSGDEVRASRKRISIRNVDHLTLKGIDDAALANIKEIANVKELRLAGCTANRIELLAKCSNVKSVAFS